MIDPTTDESVFLHVGDVLLILLRANPSTPYVWRATSREEYVLVQIGSPQFAPNPSIQFGAAQRETIKFRASHTGTTILDVDYRKAWGSAETSLQKYQIRVKVE